MSGKISMRSKHQLTIEEELFQAADKKLAELNKLGVAQGRTDISEPEQQHLPVLVALEDFENWMKDAKSYVIDKRLKRQGNEEESDEEEEEAKGASDEEEEEEEEGSAGAEEGSDAEGTVMQSDEDDGDEESGEDEKKDEEEQEEEYEETEEGWEEQSDDVVGEYYEQYGDFSEEAEEADEDEKITDEDIFKPINTSDGSTKKCSSIMVLAPAGMGKTTLLKRVAQNARREKYKELQGKLVLVLDFRPHLKGEKVLPSQVLLGDMFSDWGSERMKQRYQWIIDNAEKVVFIIDSLDTLPFDLEKEERPRPRNRPQYDDAATADLILCDILAKDWFAESIVISSSREYKIRKLHPSFWPDRCILLDGLTGESVEDLIDGFLGKARGAEVKSYIKTECPDVWPLLSIPIILVISMIGFAEDSFKPKTMSGILINFFLSLIRSSHAHVKDILTVLVKLMPLAFEGTRNLCVLFTPEQLKQYGLEPEEVTDLGILIPQSQGTFLSTKLMQNDRFFLYFNHQTQQEALASLHVLSMCLIEFKKFSECEMWKRRFTVVRRLICGTLLNKEVLEAAQDLTEISDVDEKKNILIQSLRAALQKYQQHDNENQQQDDKKKKLLELFIDLSECREGVTELIRSSVKKINFLGISLSPSDVQSVAFVMKQCEYLEEVNFSMCNLNYEKMKVLWRTTMQSNVKFKAFDVNDNKQLGVEGVHLVGKLVKNHEVKILDAGGVISGCEALKKLIEGLGDAKLEEFIISGSGELGEEGASLLGRFVKNHEVKSLVAIGSIQGCELLKKFIAGLGNAKLEKFCISQNVDLGEEGAHLLGKLVKNHEVKSLDASEGSIRDCESVEKFMEGLGDAKLEEFNISGNEELGVKGSHLLGKLVKNHEVKNLDASGGRIQGCESVQKFIEGLGDAKLEKFDISGDEDLGPEGASLLGKFVKNHEVKSLEARGSIRVDESLHSFIKGLGDTKIDKLNLSDILSRPLYSCSLLDLLPCVEKELDLRYWKINESEQQVLQQRLNEIGLPPLDIIIGSVGDPIHLKASLMELISDASVSIAEDPGDSSAAVESVANLPRTTDKLKAETEIETMEMGDDELGAVETETTDETYVPEQKKRKMEPSGLEKETKFASATSESDDETEIIYTAASISAEIERRIKTESTKSESISAEGGFVDNNGSKVTFSRGAFNTDTEVKTSLITNLSDCPKDRIPIAPSIKCSPSGKLNKSALLEIDHWAFPTGSAFYVEVYRRDDEDSERRFFKKVRIEANHKISFYVDHFTIYEFLVKCRSWVRDKILRPYFQVTVQNHVYINGLDQSIACVCCLKNEKVKQDVIQSLTKGGFIQLLPVPETTQADRSGEIKIKIECRKPKNLEFVSDIDSEEKEPGDRDIERKFSIKEVLTNCSELFYLHIGLRPGDLENYRKMLKFQYSQAAPNKIISHALQKKWPLPLQPSTQVIGSQKIKIITAQHYNEKGQMTSTHYKTSDKVTSEFQKENEPSEKNPTQQDGASSNMTVGNFNLGQMTLKQFDTTTKVISTLNQADQTRAQKKARKSRGKPRVSYSSTK